MATGREAAMSIDWVFPGPPEDDLRRRVVDQLLARRTIMVDRPLTIETATMVAAQMMTLDADGDGDGDDGETMTLLVNSPGGPLDAVGAVLDTIDLVRGPVDISCLGQAVGTAAVVVAAGSGRRRAGPGARFVLRLADVELAGTARRLGDEVAAHRRLYDAVVDRLSAATGQDRRLLVRDLERGRTLSADEAVAYGLIDEIARKDR
jgi:ATP-dependent Clp protease protease subunit